MWNIWASWCCNVDCCHGNVNIYKENNLRRFRLYNQVNFWDVKTSRSNVRSNQTIEFPITETLKKKSTNRVVKHERTSCWFSNAHSSPIIYMNSSYSRFSGWINKQILGLITNIPMHYSTKPLVSFFLYFSLFLLPSSHSQ